MDESPDYIQDQAFSGIDLYSMGVFALTGVKYQQKQIKQLQQQVNSNMAVGKAEMTSTTITVALPEGFCSEGEMPVINITPTSNNSGFYLSSSDSKSFTVNANAAFSFNWQAVRISTIENDSPVEIDEKLKSQLVVDQSKKDKIMDYWKNENAKVRAESEKNLQSMKESDPVQYERITEENRLAAELEKSEGKSAGYDVEAMKMKTEKEIQRRNAEMNKMNRPGPEEIKPSTDPALKGPNVTPAEVELAPDAPTLEKFPLTSPLKDTAPANEPIQPK